MKVVLRLILGIDWLASPPYRRRAEQPQSRVRRWLTQVHALRARRPRDLVLCDRLQRPLLHLPLPAAARRRDRLVPGALAPTAAASCSRPGARSTIPTAACPATPSCPAKSLDETYGFDWCPGDDELLEYVGSEGYRDPACDFQDAPFDASTPHGADRPAPDRLRSRVRHLDRRARPAQVPQPALRRRGVAELNGARLLGGYAAILSDDPAIPTAA